ncbi:MAG: uroporphyrinogen-III synthase [Sphingopyxis sp.]|nr:uroporphyrinogen-III synthase [Sphingopyxis sp.]
MNDAPPLIVTRPEPGNAATVERAKASGFDVRAFPLFAARPIEWTAPAFADFDALLLTSALASKLAGPELAHLASLRTYAVGSATARAAEAAGLTVEMTGSTNAQALVDVMTSTKIRDILWLCGQNRSEFDARTARIEAVPCYAVDPIQPPAEWFDVIAAPAVLLAHSARAARRISDLVGDARGHLALVAISAPVAAASGDGWGGLAVSERPDDAAMLAQAYALWHKGAK